MTKKELNDMPDSEVERIALHYKLHTGWSDIFNEYHRRKKENESKQHKLHGLNLWYAIIIVVLTIAFFYFQILVPFYGAPVPFKPDKDKIQTTNTTIEKTDTQKRDNVPLNNKKTIQGINIKKEKNKYESR